ncbi:hypothetical protein [Pseudodesulfovibrio sediminis]|uniref:Lipoprotein n=1 Tax=Pseudodesulfovibrio sediminis TaxID=2810563 RepID=A0ABM7P3M5_9BACT|nr:hypothetical protein [Pseudodesulfovibrio sediminis]BCS87381.1 hypothetical protein PSDVSF_06230 [Pseudodesulfovibrio sediminis]
MKRALIAVVLVLAVCAGCTGAEVTAATWGHSLWSMTPNKSSNGMSREEVADYCIRDGDRLMAENKRGHACGMYKQAAENGKPERYRTYCDYNWEPEE